jgi:hypothetical protein
MSGGSGWSYDEAVPSVELDATDRGANDATGVQGYPLDLRPDPNWPGLSAASGGFAADPDAMDELAERLTAEAEAVLEVPKRLKTEAQGVRFGHPNWAAANALTYANNQVARAVDLYTQKMANSMLAAARALKVSAHRIRQADGSSGGTTSRVNSNLSGGSDVVIEEWN